MTVVWQLIILCQFSCRNCIIDKNAKIGRDVVIANGDVSIVVYKSQKSLIEKETMFYSKQKDEPIFAWLMVICWMFWLFRVFKKQTGQVKDSILDPGLQLPWRTQQLTMERSYKTLKHVAESLFKLRSHEDAREQVVRCYSLRDLIWRM